VSAAGESDRLPHSIRGLVGFALSAWFANAPLYLALALFVFAVWTIAEYALPLAKLDTPSGELKVWVLQYASIFADALVIAAVALGVAARAAGSAAPARRLAAVAFERWLPVIAVTLLTFTISFVTAEFSGLGTTPIPRPFIYVTAALTWILWGILAVAGPLVALSTTRGAFSVFIGFGRAFAVSLQRDNFVRLCVLGVVVVLPMVLQTALFNALTQQHVPRGFYWANAPVDAVTIGPVSAIVTAFALDFARRAGLLEEPKPPENGG
jgi:hypothetical protein